MQHQAADPPRPLDPAAPHPLLVDQPRFRFAGDRRRPNRHTELPERVAQAPGQSVPEPERAGSADASDVVVGQGEVRRQEVRTTAVHTMRRRGAVDVRVLL